MKRSLSILGIVLLIATQAFPTSRYWVGGSGKWSDAAHWSATQNGPGGAGVPTAADDVFVSYATHANRNFRLEIDGGVVCASLKLDAPGLILFGDQSQSISIHNSLEVKQAFDDQMKGQWIFATEQTGNRISTPVAFTGSLVFNGRGAWDLASNISAKNMQLVSGSLSTSGFDVNCELFDISGSENRALYLGSSIVNIHNWDATLAENLVFDAGTSELVFAGKIDPVKMNFTRLKYYKIRSASNGKAKPTFNMFVSHPNCHDELGSILVQVTSGSPGYIYYLIGDAIQQYPAVGTTLETVHVFNNLLSNKKYLVLVVDQSDSDVKQDTMINPPAINVTSIDLTHILGCPGDNDGQIVVNASGGTGTLDYSIEEPANYQLSKTFNGLTAGTYPVRVRDDNNCETTASNQTLTEPARTVFSSVVIDSIDCRDDDDATITITASNAQRTFELSIGGAYQAGNVFNPVGDGSYTITARDQAGCVEPYGSNPLVVPNPPALSATFTTDSINCNGGNDGSITIIPAGGTAPYQYSITGGEPFTNNATFSGLGLGAYTVAVKDFHGCTAQAAAQANIYEPEILALLIDSSVNITCNGLANGKVILQAQGGTQPYIYEIGTSNQTSSGLVTFAGLSSGNYTAEVTDANGCPPPDAIKHFIDEPAVLSFTRTAFNETPCSYSDNGRIRITASGGTPDYKFSIDNGSSWITQTAAIYQFTGLTKTGSPYLVKVSDANDCPTTTVSTSINEPAPIVVNQIDSDNRTCSYSTDAFIHIDASGGTAPLSYSINNGTNYLPNNGIFDNVDAGNWNVIVKDANNCSSDTTLVSITKPDSLIITDVTINPESCPGSLDGGITVNTVTGGNAPFTYFYSFDFPHNTWGVGNSIGGKARNDVVHVQVQDDQGCLSADLSYTVTGSPAITFTATAVSAHCFGELNGTITITNPAGGHGTPYEYAIAQQVAGIWQPYEAWQAGAIFTKGAGTYRVKARDGVGCESTPVTRPISQPNDITFTTTIVDEHDCYDDNNGSITVSNVSGGNSTNYRYSLTNNGIDWQASPVFSNLDQGNYTVYVYDQVYCTKSQTVTVGGPTEVSCSFTKSDVSNCYSNSNGSIINLTGAGGSGIYTYRIRLTDSYSGVRNYPNLASGTYHVQAMDNLGCESADNVVVITAPDTVKATVVPTHITQCFGDQTGQLTITGVQNGTGPYTYLFDGNVDADNTSPLFLAGTHTAQVMDQANNCFSPVVSVNLTQPTQVILTLDETQDPLCHGDANGTIQVTASGGNNASYTYSIGVDPFISNNGFFQDLTGNTYNIRGKDANNCISATLPVTLTDPSSITATVTPSNITFAGADDGIINITNVLGGNPPYEYSIDNKALWNYPSNNTGLNPGTYHVWVRDDNFCELDKGEYNLTEPGALAIDNVTSINPLCNSENTGTITVTASGGVPPLQYIIAGTINRTQGNGNFTGLPAGTYTVSVRDNFTTVIWPATITLVDPDVLEFRYQMAFPSCFGQSTGSIVVSAQGGTPGYTYTFPTVPFIYGQPNDSTFTNLQIGNYTLTVIDANGCEETTGKLWVDPLSQITFNLAIDSITCNGDADGTITVNAAGGYAPRFYFSKDGGGNWQYLDNIFENLSPAIYTIAVKDSLGCTADDMQTVTLSNPSLLQITNKQHTNVTCFGNSTGTLTVTASGGTPPLQYVISNGVTPIPPQGNGTFINLQAGNYSISVTDAHGCLATGSEIITQPVAALNAVITTLDPDFCDGKINIIVSASGGTAPLEVSMDGINYFASPHTFVNQDYGLYTPYARDAASCSFTGPAQNITGPAPITVDSVVVADVLCFGDLTGSITIYARGENPLEYTIGGSWQASNQFNNYGANTYTVQVRNTNCTVNAGIFEIEQPASALSIIINKTDANCNGTSTGTITVAASGGVSPYQFQIWDGVNPVIGPQDNGNFTDLSAGSYSVTVTDANACIKTGTIDVGEPSAILVSNLASSSPTCFGLNDGSISFDINGGTNPITVTGPNAEIISNPPANHFVFNTLTANTYSIHVIDNKGCIHDFEVTLDDPEAITVSVVDSLLSCGSMPTILADTTFLPDGSGTSYTSTITHTVFGEDQEIVSASDIESISFNIEHSWLQDLTITLTCPTGQSMKFFDKYGGEAFLGEPVDTSTYIDLDVTPGVGYAYFFTQDAQFTWNQAYQQNHRYTYVDLLGYPHINKRYIPTGNYKPIQSFNNLIGCKLNGDWVITVKDNFRGDNGYLFSWGLNFSPDAFPPGYCNGMVEINAAGGTGQLNYAWSNGDNTSRIEDLCAADYTVTVTDANGCQTNYTTTVEDVDLQLVVDDITHVTCQGQSNGSISLHMTGGNEPYTYVWETGATTTTISNLEAGVYSFTITDFNSCEYIDSIEVSYQFSISTSMADTALVSCNSLTQGPQTGTATVVVSGTDPITYEWTNGETNATATQLPAGWNFVTVTDANLCPAVDSIFMDQPAELTANALLTEPLCNGDSNGSIAVTGGGGTGLYSILWEDGSSDNPRTVLAAGNYTFTLTDANNCFISQSLTLGQPDVLSIVVTGTPTNCGVSTGTAQVVANGGTPVYSYLWSNGSIIDQAIGLGVGMHYVTLTDFNGCTKEDSILIQNDTDLAISGYTVASPISCNGNCDGSLVVNLTGGAGPYNYAWSNGVNNDTTVNLCANTDYSVTVTDANNCVVFGTTQITEPEVLTLSIINPVNISCLGGNNGSAEASPLGGTGPYTYNWQNSLGQQVSTEITATGLTAGTYTLTVTDFHLCTATASINLTEPATAVTATHTTVAATCSNADGSAEVNPTGGVAPYTFVWSNGMGTDSIANGLSVNIYYVTVSDANHCQYVDTVEIIDNSTLSFAIDTIINLSCHNVCNGSATVVATGGTAPYDYEWSTGDVDSVAYNLCAATHSVTVTDSDGCQRTLNVPVTQPSQITTNITNNPLILCSGDTTGTATVDVNGGVSPYSFEWRDPLGGLVDSVISSDTASMIYSVVAGSYTLILTDANACVQTPLTVTISEIPAMQLSFANTNASCGNPDGESVVTVSGGTGPYTYAWSDLVTVSDTLENVPAGVYFVTVTDANLCQIIGSTTIQNNSDMVVDSVQIINSVSCHGGCDGVIRVHVSGGTNPIHYTWNTGHGSHTLANVCGGLTYSVTVTDANTCTLVYDYTVPQPDTLTVSASVVNHVLCYGDNTGAAIAIPNGGTPDYFYSWRNQANQEVSTLVNPDNLAAGRYVVIVSDQNGCQATDTIEIEQPATPLFATAEITLSSCFLPTGSAAIVPSGGTPFSGIHPYTYEWEDGITDSVHTGLGVDLYSVIVRDSNNCEFTVHFQMEDDSDLEVSIDSVKNMSCSGVCDGQAWAEVTGGSGFMSYTWSNGDTGSSADELCVGPIWVTVTDESGCKDIASANVINPEPLTVIENANDVLCAGQSTGSASVAVSGGWSPYNVTWEDMEGNEISSSQVLNVSTISGVPAGTYFYFISDGGACSINDDITIEQPDPLEVGFDVANADCDMSNGSITANITGGTLPYTIIWHNIAWSADSLNTIDITNIPAGIYYFSLTDANACSFSDVIIMNNPTAPEIDAELTHNVSCLDRCDGAAIANILVESTGNYSFEWTNGETTQEALNLCAQYYEVFAQDMNRCRAFDHITLTNDSVLQIQFTHVVEPGCHGGNDGEIAVTPYFGSGAPFTYNWEEGQTDSLITGLSTGWYYVTVSDVSNCRVEGSIFLDEPDSIYVDVVLNSPVICSDDSTGSFTVFPHGGTEPYYVALLDAHLVVVDSAFVTDSLIFANLPGQTYTIRVYDTVLCSREFLYILSNPSPMVLTFTTTETECLDSTGSAKVVVTGGYPPYTYNWFTLNEADSLLSGFDTDSIWDLPVNFYIVEIRDSIGCTINDTVEVQDKSNIDFFVTVLNHPTCEGTCNGSAFVHDISGGTPEYTYRWENAQNVETNDTAYQLCLGANQVFVIDAEGCRKVKTVNMNHSQVLQNYFVSLNDISNPGENCNGFVASFAIGGIPPYSYLWSDANHTTDSVLYNLCEGTYYLTLTDQGGCEVVDSIVLIHDPFRFEIVEVVEPACFGGEDGSVEIVAKGGYPGNYSYKWAYEEWSSYPAHDSITAKITNLKAGWYYFTLTDAGNGIITDSLLLNQPVNVVPRYVITRTECDQPTGSIRVNIESGGTGPFNFEWAFEQWNSYPLPDSTGNRLVNLGVGTYYLTVVDSKNCYYFNSVEMNDTSPFRINAIITPIRCYGWNNGSINIIPSEGQSPYSFNWQHDPNATNIASGLNTNTYYVTVTDEQNCVRDSAIFVGQPDSLQFILADTVPISCHDSCTGKITLSSVQGGNGGYTYILKQGPIQVNISGNPTIEGICEGNFNLLVRDQLGCLSEEVPFSIMAPSSISAQFTKVFAACNYRDSSGMIIANISGGTPFMGDPATAYKYLWDNGDTTHMINDLPSGYFNLHVEDSMGCPKDTLVFLDADINIYPSAEIFNFSLKDTTICYGDSIQLIGTSNILAGGNSFEPDSAVWFPGRMPVYNPKVSPHDTTRYSYIVYKANCYNFDTVRINVFPELQIDAGDYPLTFVGTEIHLLANANTEFDSVKWVGTDYALNPTTYQMTGLDTFITPKDSLWLYVTGYKYNGWCYDKDSTKIRVYQELDPPSGFTPNGDGINDTWLVPGIMEFNNVEVKIFNRWGEMVYEVKGRYQPWEGKNKKGKMLPIGTYYYIIDLHDGKTKPVSGPVTIIR